MCQLVHPTLGLLTSVGPQHLETFGSIEKVAATKNELIECLPEDGQAYFAADGGWCEVLYAQCRKPKTLAGLKEGAPFRAKDISVSPSGTSFTLVTPQGEISCVSPLLGKHNVQNVVLCAAAAQGLGLSLEQIGTLGGVFTLCNAIFVWVFGFLSDKIGFRKTVLGFAVLGVVVYALYPVYAGLGYAAAFAMAIFFNVGQINAYFGPNVMLPLFGKNKSNVTISWSSMIASTGAMLAPVVVKFAGSYNNFFIIGAVIYVIVLVLTIIATMPSSLQKIKDVDAKYVEAHGITEAE